MSVDGKETRDRICNRVHSTCRHCGSPIAWHHGRGSNDSYIGKFLFIATPVYYWAHIKYMNHRSCPRFADVSKRPSKPTEGSASGYLWFFQWIRWELIPTIRHHFTRTETRKLVRILRRKSATKTL